MENSTSIKNLEDNVQDNSKEIDNIINQIQQDNSHIQSTPQQDKSVNKKEVLNEQEFKYEDEDEDESQYEEPNYTMYDVIYNEVSYPLLVIILFIMLSIPQVDSMLCSYISFICSDSGDINFFGILLKSLLMGLLFYILGKYVV
jgi:hypothetical protein|tara:strand:+ start:329 stop:760 length:432 start_codon:yes stop_codon:yes gene_type:complete